MDTQNNVSERGNPIIEIDGRMVEICTGETDSNAGNWQVVLWTYPNVIGTGYWHIVNLKTGQFVRIGRVGAKRANYFENAKQEAARRNDKERERAA